jgi:hypothetical protein
MAPKAKDSHFETMKQKSVIGGTLPLVCPVQGYPAPSFRYIFFIFFSIEIFLNLEPQTHMRPKIKDKELGQAWKFAEKDKTLPLVCAVQGYPAPAFRYPKQFPLAPQSPKQAFPLK